MDRYSRYDAGSGVATLVSFVFGVIVTLCATWTLGWWTFSSKHECPPVDVSSVAWAIDRNTAAIDMVREAIAKGNIEVVCNIKFGDNVNVCRTDRKGCSK